MQVDFKVVADGKDITALIKDRLISISIVDEAGMKSDTATLVIDDRDYRIELPEAGAELEIWLGFKETELISMGKYTVDDISGSGPVDKMTITAKAADMLKAIKSPKTRNWDDVTLGDIVSKIAGEHDLDVAVSENLKGHLYKYLAQTSESDLNLLTRLAKELDATAKPSGNTLVFVERGKGKTAAGDDIPIIKLARQDLKSWSWKVSGRGKYKTAIAEWSELGTAAVHKIKEGSGEPTLKLRHRYATADEATRAAKGALSRSKRASSTLSASLGGFWGDLFAEGIAELDGVKSELTGEWSITRVEHRLQNTLTTRFDAERDNAA